MAGMGQGTDSNRGGYSGGKPGTEMRPPIRTASTKEDGEMTQHQPTCGECGSMIGDVERHTAWHAGGSTVDARAVVLDFLETVDVGALHKAALSGGGMGQDPIQSAMAVLKEAAAKL